MQRVSNVVLVLAGVAIGACAMQQLKPATAQPSGSQRCDYSYLIDSGQIEIGQVGEVEYDDEWKTMVENGWRLLAVERDRFIFERCR